MRAANKPASRPTGLGLAIRGGARDGDGGVRSQMQTRLRIKFPANREINREFCDSGAFGTNVWKYPGFNSFGRGRDEALAMHPTVKPVAMVVDALMDCSNRDGIVLDPFGGSGTTMIAAERARRRARLIEIDPLYCDLIVQRWQTISRKIARLGNTNETFDEVKLRRTTENISEGATS